MIAELSKTDQIKKLYNQLDSKGQFKSEIAKKIGLSVKYVTNYWFPSCDGITEIHQNIVLEELQKKISGQEDGN